MSMYPGATNAYEQTQAMQGAGFSGYYDPSLGHTFRDYAECCRYHHQIHVAKSMGISKAMLGAGTSNAIRPKHLNKKLLLTKR